MMFCAMQQGKAGRHDRLYQRHCAGRRVSFHLHFPTLARVLFDRTRSTFPSYNHIFTNVRLSRIPRCWLRNSAAKLAVVVTLYSAKHDTASL